MKINELITTLDFWCIALSISSSLFLIAYVAWRAVVS